MVTGRGVVRGGARISRFDPRDAALRFGEVDGSSGLDLTAPWPPRDQGSVPCCVAIAVCGAMEILRPQPEPLSALHLYWSSRPAASSLGLVDLRAALRAAQRIGVVSESRWPGCAPGGPAVVPDAARLPWSGTDLPALRIGPLRSDDEDSGYARVRGSLISSDWIAALRHGDPVVAIIPLVPEHAALAAGADPVLRVVSPSPTTTLHAVLVTGFVDGSFRVRDSQGPQFGAAGDWWLARELVDAGFVTESWVIRQVVED